MNEGLPRHLLPQADALRFQRQFEPGVGNYTEERNTILPDWDARTLARKAVQVGSRKP